MGTDDQQKNDQKGSKNQSDRNDQKCPNTGTNDMKKSKTNQIDCMEYRNKMNNALKKSNIHDILIITAEMSKTKNSIIFTVTKKNTANQLIQN